MHHALYNYALQTVFFLFTLKHFLILLRIYKIKRIFVTPSNTNSTMLIKNLDLSNVLVLDIETVSGQKSYADLSETMQGLWDIKSEQLQRRLEEADRMPHSDYYRAAAGIFAEFGKIVCISVGAFRRDEATGEWFFRVKSYYNDNEKQLLMEFSALLEGKFNNANRHFLCGHNIREFDIPYICRRMVIQGMPLPTLLDISGKKPWDVKWMIDTMELWKFGDYKNPTALKLLCGVFDIPTPKDDIDGSQVGTVYWDEGDLERIQVYCRKDVVATAQLLLRFQQQPLIKTENVQYV